MIVLDLTGQRFGRLTVLERCGSSKDGQKIYRCQCDCGRIKEVKSGNLRSGKTKSCGCITSENTTKRNKQNAVHGGCGTRLYTIWLDMRQRCYNDKSINWHLYGGRGIKVCKEWDEDFAEFRDWALSHGYDNELQLDRIDNDGNYEPNNCKWSSRVEQGNNRRTCVYITINGERKTLSEWCEKTGISRYTAYSRIRRGWEPERAVTEKEKSGKKLSEKDVRYIKKHYNAKVPKYNKESLAKRFNVSGSTIEAIIGGRNWKSVTTEIGTNRITRDIQAMTKGEDKKGMTKEQRKRYNSKGKELIKDYWNE